MELQKQDIELLLIIESSMWAVVTAYTLAGLHWFWRKRAGAERQQRRFSGSVCKSSPPPGRSTFHCLRRFHIKVHLFKWRMTLLNTEYTYVTLKWTSRVIDKLLTTIRKSAAVLPFKSRRRTDCRSFTSRSSQTSRLFPGNPERRADVRRGLRAEIICDRDP